MNVTRYTINKLKIIVGLGNPGEKYKKNRHNVGCMFVEHFLETYNAKRVAQNVNRFKMDKYLQSEVVTLHDTRFALHDLVIIKPQTYMNKSGEAVAACVKRYALHDLRSELIIVHDDLDIPFGKFKIQTQGPKAHNGLTDIQNKLQTMDFLRIRIGVDNRPAVNRMQGEEYVLQNFTEEEAHQLPAIFAEIASRLTPFL